METILNKYLWKTMNKRSIKKSEEVAGYILSLYLDGKKGLLGCSKCGFKGSGFKSSRHQGVFHASLKMDV